MDRALARQLPLTIADRAPWLAARLEVVTADAAGVTELPGEPPTALVANLPYNVAVPVLLHVLATVAVTPAPGSGDGPDRGRRPDGRGPGQPDLRRAVSQAGLVRHGAAEPGRCPARCSGRLPRVDSGLVELVERHEPGAAEGETAGTAGLLARVPQWLLDGGAGVAVGRDEVFAVIDAAFSQRRRDAAVGAGQLGAARRPPRKTCCGRPTSIRHYGARRWASASSPGSPPRPPRALRRRTLINRSARAHLKLAQAAAPCGKLGLLGEFPTETLS